MSSDSDPARALFAVPPAEFVAARDQLAGALKKAGKKAEAAAIKAMVRPTASVWAINQLALQHADPLTEYLDASQELAHAQATTAAGQGARAATFQASVAKQRDALERLMEVVPATLETAGLAANRTVLDRVANNLRWGVLDEASRALLGQGQLQKDVEPPDFSALVDRIPILERAAPEASPASRIPATAPPGKGPALPVKGPARKATEESPAQAARQAERERQGREADAMRVQLKASRAQAQRLRDQLAVRTAEHQRAQSRLTELRHQLDRVEREVEQAESLRQEAAQAVQHHEERLADLNETLERVEAALRSG